MKKTKVIFIALLFTIILCIAGYCWDLNRKFISDSPDKVKVSLDSGFYETNQIITVEAPKGAVIYYTDNCEIPDRTSAMEYQGPIFLNVDTEEQVLVYRFKVWYEDGTESEVITRSYFLGESLSSRYTTNVLHIVGSPDDLYGYENGIFCKGKLFDEFIAENPDAHLGAGVDANFMLQGAEAEREVYIEYFSSDGESLFAQNGGVRIHGRVSRLMNQKSFKLYARSEYDVQNKFRYPLFKDLISSVDGTVAQEYKRLIVRNSGNDNRYASIRSELGGELAGIAGFPDVIHSEPICVYINGIYQGFYWLENSYDSQYFENRYGKYNGEFVVLEGGDTEKSQDEDSDTQGYVDEYNQMYQKFSATDLTDDDNYAALCKILDVENYLEYFAIENYILNTDWPDNNIKVYRYVAENDNYTEGTVFDGRYRHLLYDLDFGFGLGQDATYHSLEMVLEKSPLFQTLMKREDCREYFISYTCDLINGAMKYENVENVLQEKHASRYEEIFYMLTETDIQQGALWSDEDCVEYANVEAGYNKILNFAENRPGAVFEDLIQTFDLRYEDLVTVNISKGNCYSGIQINGNYIEEEIFTGNYLTVSDIQVLPVLAINERFEHWIVNGEIVQEEQLTLTEDDQIDGQISIELVVTTAEDVVLQINSICAKGNADFIEIINMSDKSVTTKGYFLSDSEDMYKYVLPNVLLQPGETRRFYGKDCTDVEALGQFGLNFNLKQGETITLSRGEQILETLQVPDLSENSIYQRSGNTGKFVEILKEQK